MSCSGVKHFIWKNPICRENTGQRRYSRMMGKTHYAIGLATALAVIHPQTLNECFVAVIGGSIGGVLADNDTLDHDYHSDALSGQALAFATAAIVLALDYFLNAGICSTISGRPMLPIIGMIGFIILYVVGYFSNHRTFTHSFLTLILYALTSSLIYMPLGISLSVAYLSHLLLDVLNKKKVPLLYPLKFGICLKLCYASKTANKVLMYTGFAATIILLGISLFLIL